MAALMLDPETGLDPPGVKIRAAQGIDAAQKFIEGYWLWWDVTAISGNGAYWQRTMIREKILQNLAALNYDTNNLELAAYDWRLSYQNLEIRDGYFSRLKHAIESHKSVFKEPSGLQHWPIHRKLQGKKTVIVAHSMGATVGTLASYTSIANRLFRSCLGDFGAHRPWN
jgi:phospholipid:diacylglycerol acyltransferase